MENQDIIINTLRIVIRIHYLLLIKMIFTPNIKRTMDIKIGKYKNTSSTTNPTTLMQITCPCNETKERKT